MKLQRREVSYPGSHSSPEPGFTPRPFWTVGFDPFLNIVFVLFVLNTLGTKTHTHTVSVISLPPELLLSKLTKQNTLDAYRVKNADATKVPPET